MLKIMEDNKNNLMLKILEDKNNLMLKMLEDKIT